MAKPGIKSRSMLSFLALAAHARLAYYMGGSGNIIAPTHTSLCSTLDSAPGCAAPNLSSRFGTRTIAIMGNGQEGALYSG